MNYSHVLCFGDSTPSGMELIHPFDPTTLAGWSCTKQLRYPNQLSNMLGIPCINLAEVGYNNDRSLRLLPEALLTYPNSLVLFNYTYWNRTEFFTLNPKLPQLVSEGYVPLGTNQISAPGSDDHKHMNEMYLKYFYENPDGHNRYRQYNMILTVQLFCEQFSKNYLQIFPYNGLFLSPVYQEIVYNTIDKSHIYQFDHANDNISWDQNNEGFGSLEHWARSKKYAFGPMNHILHEAHNQFALDLYERVK